MRKVILGSRESRLAVIQTELVLAYIRENCPQITAEMLTMKTTGDKILSRRLEQIGGKGLFVRELDLALKEKRSDLSVHSLKDMPMEVPESLPVIGFSRREDPRDVLVLPQGQSEPDPSLPIGTSSRRRELQLHTLYPHIPVKSVRGNVQTRLAKLDRGEYGALVLAAAGLKRLGLEERISRYFSTEEMIPAAGQGILCIQGREGEDYRFLDGFFDADTACAAKAERAFVRYLDGGCSSPVAAFAKKDGDRLHLTGFYEDAAGRGIRAEKEGSAEEPEALGIALAKEMRG